MEQAQSSSVLVLVTGVADPRAARGKQVEWDCMWGVIAAARFSFRRRSSRTLAVAGGRGIARMYYPGNKRQDALALVADASIAMHLLQTVVGVDAVATLQIEFTTFSDAAGSHTWTGLTPLGRST